MKVFKTKDGVTYKLVFAKSKLQDGKRIYPKKAKCFVFWVKVDDTAA